MPSFTITTNEVKKATSKKKYHKKSGKAKVSVPRVDDSKKVQEEIKELETKKGQIGGGWRGFLGKASINKQIYEKKKFLGAREGLRNVRAETERIEARLKLEDARSKLGELRKKSQVSFEGLSGFGGNSGQKKQVKFEDLFK